MLALVPQTIPPRGSQLPVVRPRIERVFPHDPRAFTQGLQYVGGALYEGTGLHGRSAIRRVELETGRVLLERRLEEEHFGEGIAVAGQLLYQLTWESRVGFVYDRDTFERRGEFAYSGEGWGLAFDGANLVMSNGTATLRYLDPQTFATRRRVTVHDGGVPIHALNALACVDAELFANVWFSDFVARIRPSDGAMTGWLDLRGLLSRRERHPDAVLNGIAWDPDGRRLFVTGKLWPKLFQLSLDGDATSAG